MATINVALFVIWFVAYWLIDWDVTTGPIFDLLRFTLPLLCLLVAGKVFIESMISRFVEPKWLAVAVVAGLLPVAMWAVHWIFVLG